MRILVLSDPHHAGPAECARRGWEKDAIRNPVLRRITGLYRRFLWLADPTAHNHHLDDLLRVAGEPDLVVANGDYSCDSAFIGMADDAAFASARECLDKLKAAYGDRLRLVMGDHEPGKMSMFGSVGGPRLLSWQRTTRDLGVPAFWTEPAGSNHVLVGVPSSLLALEIFEPELLSDERDAWHSLRESVLARINEFFATLPPQRRVILFCHDPTALPYLAREPEVRPRLHQLDVTIIGHLHSELILRVSRCFAGMPPLDHVGHTARRLSRALRKARAWKPFNPVLCPSLAGIQLLKDGGYLTIEIPPSTGPDPTGRATFQITRHRLPWA